MNFRLTLLFAASLALLASCDKLEVEDGLVKEFSPSNTSKLFEVGKANTFEMNIWINPNERLLAVKTDPDEASKRITITTTIERRWRMGTAVPGIIDIQPATGSFISSSTGSFLLFAPSTGATQSILIQ